MPLEWETIGSGRGHHLVPLQAHESSQDNEGREFRRNQYALVG